MTNIKIIDYDVLFDNLEINELPLFADSSFKYNININNKEFIFWFKWNNAGEFWSLEIYNQLEELLITTKIVPNWNLIQNYQYLFDLNTPVLFCYNIINNGEYPTQFNLGDDHKLLITNIVLEQ